MSPDAMFWLELATKMAVTAAFLVAASAMASLAANAVTGLFALVYILVAQVRGPLASLAVALGFWLAAIFTVRSFQWTLPGALAINAASYLVAVPVARRFRSAKFRPPRRRWYDVPLRAGLVAVLVATAAILANTLPGLVGFAFAMLALHLASVPLGKAAALILALAISIGWNLTLWLNRHRGW